MNRFLHGLSGDKQFLAVVIFGNLFRIAIPVALFGAIALVWWLLP